MRCEYEAGALGGVDVAWARRQPNRQTAIQDAQLLDGGPTLNACGDVRAARLRQKTAARVSMTNSISPACSARSVTFSQTGIPHHLPMDRRALLIRLSSDEDETREELSR